MSIHILFSFIASQNEIQRRRAGLLLFRNGAHGLIWKAFFLWSEAGTFTSAEQQKTRPQSKPKAIRYTKNHLSIIHIHRNYYLVDMHMRIILIVISVCVFVITGCRAFPDGKFQVNGPLLDFFRSSEKLDTFLFKGDNRTDTFVLTKIDSSIFNSKISPMGVSPYKTLYIEYKQIPVNHWASIWIKGGTSDTVVDNATMIALQTLPGDSSTQLTISFMNFTAQIHNKFPPMYQDTLRVGSFCFTNYYRIQDAELGKIDSAGPQIMYITIKDGLVAYQNYYGKWWTRQPLH